MKLYGDPGEPRQALRDIEYGYRPRYLRLLKQINTDDLAWPITADILREMAEAGIEIDETVIKIASKLGAHRLAAMDAYKEVARQPKYHKLTLDTAGSIVYYVRRGDLIKIGTTANPPLRFRDLAPDDILAFEPGTSEEERCRHNQFDHLRVHGEYFRKAPELIKHCRELRKIHGDPDPAWRTMASATKPPRPPLPEVTSGEVMTALQAQQFLNVKADRVWQAARYGQIPVAGHRDTRGRKVQVYYVEHLLTLRGAFDQRGHTR